MKILKVLIPFLWTLVLISVDSFVPTTERRFDHHDKNRILLVSTEMVATSVQGRFQRGPAANSSYKNMEPKTSAVVEVKPLLVHGGFSANMVCRSPSIAGATLCSGWSEESTNALRKAIHDMVRENQILSGHVYTTRAHGKKNVWIKPGTFRPGKHEFLKVTKIDKKGDFANMDEAEMMNYVTENYFPLLEESELTSTQVKKKLPLFSAQLVLLPDNHAIYSVKMSHAVGDGVTFFHLIHQLSCRMAGFDNCPVVDWSCPLKATHEFYPESFSKRDAHISYGPPMMMGAFRNILFTKRQPKMILVHKHEVNAKKRELRQVLGCKDISSNDVLTAALCKANKSSDIFVFTENVRGVKEDIPRNAGGNFLWEIPVSREVASNPDKLRQTIRTHQGCYDTNEIPLQPFISGRVARITSLATIAENTTYKTTAKTLCVLPYLSFVKDIPLDVALIFRFDQNYWGVVHNFAQFDDDIFSTETGKI